MSDIVRDDVMLIGLFSLRLPVRCARPELNSDLVVGLFSWGLFAVRMSVDYFQDARGAVKGEWKKMVSESLVMCIDGLVNAVDAGVIVGRSAMITEAQVSRLLLNQAQTRAFYSAEFLSGFRSSPEPVVVARDAQQREDHGERRVGVKGNLFSQYSSWSGELKESEQRVGSMMHTGRQSREVILAPARPCAVLADTRQFVKTLQFSSQMLEIGTGLDLE